MANDSESSNSDLFGEKLRIMGSLLAHDTFEIFSEYFFDLGKVQIGLSYLSSYFSFEAPSFQPRDSDYPSQN